MKTRAYIGTTRVFSKIKSQALLDHVDFVHNDTNFFDEKNISVTRHQPSYSSTEGRDLFFRYPGDANFIGVGTPVINDVYADAPSDIAGAGFGGESNSIPSVNNFLKFSINNLEIGSNETMIIQTMLSSINLSSLNISGANYSYNVSNSDLFYSLTNTSNLTDLDAGSFLPLPSESVDTPESLVQIKMTGLKLVMIEEEIGGKLFLNRLSKTITFSDAFHAANQTTFTVLLDNTRS